MFSKSASIALSIFTLVQVGILYSRRIKPDLGNANKLAVDLALPSDGAQQGCAHCHRRTCVGPGISTARRLAGIHLDFHSHTKGHAT